MARTPLIMAPIIQTILTGVTAADEGPRAVVLQGGVHGWMEGHLAATGHHVSGRPPHPDEMPSPPFPDPNSERLAEILQDAWNRFSADETPAALAYVIGLAWQAGYQEGMDCPGCSLHLADGGPARAMREGRMTLRWHETSG